MTATPLQSTQHAPGTIRERSAQALGTVHTPRCVSPVNTHLEDVDAPKYTFQVFFHDPPYVWNRVWWNKFDYMPLAGICLLCLARGRIYWGVRTLCVAVVATSHPPKGFQYLWLAQALPTLVAAKHLEKVLAPFVAVHVQSGFKKDKTSELSVKHDPNIDYSYERESLDLLVCFWSNLCDW